MKKESKIENYGRHDHYTRIFRLRFLMITMRGIKKRKSFPHPIFLILS